LGCQKATQFIFPCYLVYIMKQILFYLIVIIFSCHSFSCYSQATMSETNGVFILNPNQKSDEGKSFRRGTYTDVHFFGEDITSKLDLFERNYVYFLPGTGAYAVEEKKILKPEIYKKIKFLDKSFVKAVKQNKMNLEDASIKFSSIVSLSIKLLNYDTANVEKDLKKMNNDLNDVIAYFEKIRLHEPNQ